MFFNLGRGEVFDTQKQFLANIADAINSAVDIPVSIDRYQNTLQYTGARLHMIPSDMDLYIGTINGYNNLTVIASPDEIKSIQLGQNTVNDAPVILQEHFQSSLDDFSFEDEPVISQSSQDNV